MKLAIVVPSGDMVHADFSMCLARMIGTLGGRMQVALINPKSSLIQKGRTCGTMAALKADTDFILMIDSDMTFPPNAALRLLNHQKPIVGATYPRRRPPYSLVGRKANGKPWKLHDLGYGLKPAHELGCGMMLIANSAFEALPMPWFHVEQEVNKAGEVEWTSEDEFFCHLAATKDFDIHCDTDLSLEIGHLGVREYKARSAP